jgi:hypothetical protein
MASTNGIIFPESMADIFANPVDICFGSMSAKSTAPATCLVIKGNAVTTDQSVLIGGDRVSFDDEAGGWSSGYTLIGGDRVAFDDEAGGWSGGFRRH